MTRTSRRSRAERERHAVRREGREQPVKYFLTVLRIALDLNGQFAEKRRAAKLSRLVYFLDTWVYFYP